MEKKEWYNMDSSFPLVYSEEPHHYQYEEEDKHDTRFEKKKKSEKKSD